jgi:hypothetical protein
MEQGVSAPAQHRVGNYRMKFRAWKLLASAALMAGACSPSDASRRADAATATETGAAQRGDQAEAEAESDPKSDFVLGNIAFILFHELGHAMITEFELPVLGREEDAVDNFASMLLTPDNDDPKMDASILVDAMTGWFASAELTALEDIAWWDEHGPDQQRAYQIACVLYGSKAGAYDALAEEIGLPEERRARCADEYQAVFNAWGQLLGPHLLNDGETPEARIVVSYGEPGEYAAERALLKESELMETLANEISTSFRFSRQLRMKGMKCGEPNAFWDGEAGEITICYELVRDYAELYAKLAAAE